jgi:hypothetical protein
MGKKAPKASRKLAVKGEIKRQIQERHKHQKLKKRIDGRKAQKVAKSKEHGKARGKENEEVHDGGDGAEETHDAESKYGMDLLMVGLVLKAVKVPGHVRRRHSGCRIHECRGRECAHAI